MKDATKQDKTIVIHAPVSIHASVKDATKYMPLCDAVEYVSIHASVKDATIGRAVHVVGYVFQSTRP